MPLQRPRWVQRVLAWPLEGIRWFGLKAPWRALELAELVWLRVFEPQFWVQCCQRRVWVRTLELACRLEAQSVQAMSLAAQALAQMEVQVQVQGKVRGLAEQAQKPSGWTNPSRSPPAD